MTAEPDAPSSKAQKQANMQKDTKSHSELQIPSTGKGNVEMSPEELNKLSPEEQLAHFEEAMKNDDWGHQPC